MSRQREGAIIYMTGFTISVTARNFAHFVWRVFLSVARWFRGFSFPFVSLGPRIWCGRRRSSLFRLWPPYKSPCTGLSWLKLHESPMEHSPCVFHWRTLSHFPLNVGFISFLTLGDWSSFHNFAPNPEVSSFRLCSIWSFYSCLQSQIIRLSIVSSSFLKIQSQHNLKLSRILICTVHFRIISEGHFTHWW